MNINHLAMLLKYPFYPWYRHDLIKQDKVYRIDHLGSICCKYTYGVYPLDWICLCIEMSYYDSLGFDKVEDYSKDAGLR